MLIELEILDKIQNKSNLWISQNYPQVFSFIDNLKIGLSWKEKLFIYQNNIDNIPNCYCGSELSFISFKKGYREFCSKKCVANSQNIFDKKKKTCLSKYGVDNPMKNIDIQNKQNVVILNKYGVSNISKLDSIKEKVKETNNLRFGKDYISQTLEVRKKLSDILTLKQDKMVELNRKRRDSNVSDKTRDLNIKFISAEYSDYNFECGICLNNFIIHKNMLNDRIRNKNTICTLCNKINSGSNAQEQIIQILSKIYTGKIIKNDRKTIKGELDIYLPELNIAIEYNGIYWHSEIYKEENYHINKTTMCNEKSIKLIHIWEDEWLLKKEIILSRLINLFGKSDKIFARKCKVKQLTSEEYRLFLEKTHLQGFVGSKYKIGLVFNDEIVCAMSFGELRKNLGYNKKEGSYELLRYSCKLNTNVVGGASKLLSYFLKNNTCDKIISYADIGWSSGNLYEKLGFKRIKITKPNYFYVKNGKRYYRFSFRKDVLVSMGEDMNMSETQIMKKNGFYKIYNCGSYKYEMII
jgi:hypothetical protein